MMESRYYITDEIEIRKENINRILSRESEPVKNYKADEKLKIGIIGISGSAGCSFLAAVLARYLAVGRARKPAVVELGTGSIFDSLGMDKHFTGREYFQFFRALEEGTGIRGKTNMDEGINWVIRSPGEYNCNITTDQKLRLLYSAAGDIILSDLSGCGDDYESLIQHMDQILAVIDPMPSKMLEGIKLLQELKNLDDNRRMIFIVNKFNQGVNRREMLDFLKIRKPLYIPLIRQENIYTAEYTCRNPFSIREIRNCLNDPLNELVDSLNF